MIKFRCPNCNQKLGVPDEYSGRRIRCSKCSQPSIVPKPAPQKPQVSVKAKPDITEQAFPDISASQTAPDMTESDEKLQEQKDIFADLDIDIEEDHNAEIIKQVRQKHMVKQKAKGRKSSKKEKNITKNDSERKSRSHSFSLSEFLPEALGVPLGLALAAIVMGVMIIIWIVSALATEKLLGIFVMLIPISGAMGFRLLSNNRTFLMALLIAGMGMGAIALGKASIAKKVMIPISENLANEEILKDIKPLLENEKLQLPQSESSNFIANDGDLMVCIMLFHSVDENQIDPIKARQIAFNILRRSNKTNLFEFLTEGRADHINYEEPKLSEEENLVLEKIGLTLFEMEDIDRRRLARKYYPVLNKLANQVEIRRILDNPDKRYQYAFIASLGIFDIIWIMAGIGLAYMMVSLDQWG